MVLSEGIFDGFTCVFVFGSEFFRVYYSQGRFVLTLR